MPNRIVRDGLLDSEIIQGLTDQTFRFYTHLILAADDAGRFDGRPEFLRSRLFPLDSSRRVSDVCVMRDEAAERNAIRVYEVGGKPVIQVMKWQCCGKAEHSKYPSPTGDFRIRYVTLETRDGEKRFVDTSLPDGVNMGSAPDRDGITVDPNTKTDTKTDTKTKAGEPPDGELDDEGFFIPRSLCTPEFKAAWQEWKAYRRERKPKVTKLSAKQSMNDMAQWGPGPSIESIRMSISCSWQGIFPPRGRQGQSRNGASKSVTKTVLQGRT